MPLTQAQKETLFVWTILTANRFEMDMNGGKALKKELKKLHIDAAPLLLAASTTHLNHFIAIRNLFRDAGFTVASGPAPAKAAPAKATATKATAAKSAAAKTARAQGPAGLALDAAAAPTDGGTGWSGNGSHPSLEELTPLFQLS